MQDLVNDPASCIQEIAGTSLWDDRTKREHWLLELWAIEDRTIISAHRYLWWEKLIGSPLSGTSDGFRKYGQGQEGHPSEWSEISRCFSRYPLSLRGVQSEWWDSLGISLYFASAWWHDGNRHRALNLPWVWLLRLEKLGYFKFGSSWIFVSCANTRSLERRMIGNIFINLDLFLPDFCNM